MSFGEKVSVFDTGKNQIDPATKQLQEELSLKLGEEGATPPSLEGSGIQGYLRAIFETLSTIAGQKNSEQSTFSVNSANTVGGDSRWSAGDTVFVGAGEALEYEYVYTSVVVEGANANLEYQFSPNGVDYSSFPTEGFDVTNTVHEYHAAHKGLRHFRPRIVFDAAPTAVRIFVYYTNTRVKLNSPIRQILSLDSDADPVRAVASGQVRNPDGTGSNVVDNAQLTPERAQIVDMPPTAAVRGNFELNGSIPSGPMPTFDKVGPVVASNVVDSGWIDMRRFLNAFNHMTFNQSGVQVFLMNASDAQGNNSTTTDFSSPNAVSVANVPISIGAPFFQAFFRFVIINTSGAACDGYAYSSEGSNAQVSPIMISADQPILLFFPMPLGQSLIRGASDDGTPFTYPVQVHRNPNTGAVSLAVVQGARISEAFGKVHIQETASAEGTLTPVTLTLHQVTQGFRFWLTSIEVSLTNELSSGGILEVTDDSVVIRQYAIPSGTNQTTGTTTLTTDYTEPVLFETDVEFVVPATGLGSNVAVNITGYEEPA